MDELLTDEEIKNKAQTILQGFKLHKISLKEPDSQEIVWSCKDDLTKSNEEVKVSFPRDVNEKPELLLEIIFSSIEPMDNFLLRHRLLFKHKCLEEWSFEFGPVDEKSKHTWLIAATHSVDAPNMPWEALSGNLILETKYFDQDIHFCTTFLRLFYEIPS